MQNMSLSQLDSTSDSTLTHVHELITVYMQQEKLENNGNFVWSAHMMCMLHDKCDQ